MSRPRLDKKIQEVRNIILSVRNDPVAMKELKRLHL
jgi:hypothetical protein